MLWLHNADSSGQKAALGMTSEKRHTKLTYPLELDSLTRFAHLTIYLTRTISASRGARLRASAAGWLIVLLLALAGTGASAQGPLVDRSVMVIPFQNASGSSDLEWVREAFPEVVGQRLQSPALYVVSRDERVAAMDHFGFPASVQPSRASSFRLAEQMDLDYVVLGRYALDGALVRVNAQLLDVRGKKLGPEVQESGTLAQLVSIQLALAWDVMRQMHPDLATSRDAFVASSNAVRLDALEHYMRGVTALSASDRIGQLQAALKLSPDYLPALLQLGKAYFAAHKYEEAVRWFGQVPIETDQAREANFLLGLAACNLGQYERAETAFNFLATRFPLTEVYNNLGVVAVRRGRRNAAEFFQKAVQADPSDADYHFNLGVTLYRAGDLAGAAKQLQETLSRRPSDVEAKTLLDSIGTAPTPLAAGAPSGAAATSPKIPAERLKVNYDENSYRQLALQIQILNEQRLASSNPTVHASFHLQRGQQLLAQGFSSEAEREFREALLLEPANAEAHLGLGRAREVAGDWAGARSEAEAALAVDPKNATALELRARMAAKAAEGRPH